MSCSRVLRKYLYSFAGRAPNQSCVFQVSREHPVIGMYECLMMYTICIYSVYVWVNYNELTTSSLEIIVSKGNHPQMAARFRLVNYYNLPRYVYLYEDHKTWDDSGPFLPDDFRPTLLWWLVVFEQMTHGPKKEKQMSSLNSALVQVLEGFWLLWKMAHCLYIYIHYIYIYTLYIIIYNYI